METTILLRVVRFKPMHQRHSIILISRLQRQIHKFEDSYTLPHSSFSQHAAGILCIMPRQTKSIVWRISHMHIAEHWPQIAYVCSGFKGLRTRDKQSWCLSMVALCAVRDLWDLIRSLEDIYWLLVGNPKP